MNAFVSHILRGLDDERCVCGWRGTTSELTRTSEVEIMHPKNRHLQRPLDGNLSSYHATLFQSCPICNRAIVADGRRIEHERSSAPQ